MWQLPNEALANAESKHNLCTKSLLNNLIKSRRIGSASSNSLDQQSNSSSLESIESFALDCNQALSTSCSEDSFEMSSTTSRPTTEDPSQLSFQGSDLTSTSGFLGPENSMQQSNMSSSYRDRKSSECNRTEQMSKDSLESCNSWKKSNLLKNMDFSVKKSPLALASDHLDRSSETTGIREISRDETAASDTVSREGLRTTESWPVRHSVPDTWKRDKSSLRQYIDKELDNLDTCLPQLDFNKLEEKLNCAAKERVVTERKLLGEQVNFSFCPVFSSLIHISAPNY